MKTDITTGRELNSAIKRGVKQGKEEKGWDAVHNRELANTCKQSLLLKNI